MIIATAGHVDHGKTSLLRALTGTDADRLPEEKRRGMTLDLGYAFLLREDGCRLGFVDVPGHEKFLSNMLAGVGGIDHALLLVACDDGVMPQTREHLAILALCASPTFSVVLSKRDLVSEQQAAHTAAAVAALFAELGLPAPALFEVDSLSGRGIPALRAHLCAQAAPARAARRFRLAIDRAFSVKGAGLVVTGTALAGRVRVGDTLWLTGRERPVRVRALHAQNHSQADGGAGERLALNLAGDVSRDDIARGDWLLASPPPAPSSRVSVELTILAGAKIEHWQVVHLHHGARHITGRVALLQGSLAELQLDTALHLADNDRLLLRDAAARHTLGSARVLELAPAARGKRQPARLAYLDQLAAASSDSAALATSAAFCGVNLGEAAWARQRDDVAALAVAAGLVCAAGHALSPARWQQLQHALLSRLAELHQAQADALGAARSRLKRLALPGQHEALADAAIDALLASGALVSTRGWLHLPGHIVSFTAAEAALWTRLAPLFGSEVHWVRDLAQQAGSDEASVRQLLKKAARLGHVVAIVPDRYCSSYHAQHMAHSVRELVQQHGYADAASFRDRAGIGRKLAIQVLECFDKSGLTRRQGDRHLLRDATLFAGSADDPALPAA